MSLVDLTRGGECMYAKFSFYLIKSGVNGLSCNSEESLGSHPGDPDCAIVCEHLYQTAYAEPNTFIRGCHLSPAPARESASVRVRHRSSVVGSSDSDGALTGMAHVHKIVGGFAFLLLLFYCPIHARLPMIARSVTACIN
jgi:hypothetical protein